MLTARRPFAGNERYGIAAATWTFGCPTAIIMMTGHGDVPMVRTAFKAGAVDFLPKPFQDRELLEAVGNAFALESAQRAAAKLERMIMSRVSNLTPREREIMDLVTAGWTNIEIATHLDVSLVTVKVHRGQVMEKMQAESLADLVKMSERINLSQIQGISGSNSPLASNLHGILMENEKTIPRDSCTGRSAPLLSR